MGQRMVRTLLTTKWAQTVVRLDFIDVSDRPFYATVQ